MQTTPSPRIPAGLATALLCVCVRMPRQSSILRTPSVPPFHFSSLPHSSLLVQKSNRSPKAQLGRRERSGCNVSSVTVGRVLAIGTTVKLTWVGYRLKLLVRKCHEPV